jgi:hypothetical protein
MNENIHINGYCKVDRNISHHKINRAFLLGICSLQCSTAYILVGVPPGEGQDEGI